MANLAFIVWLEWTNLFQQSHCHFTPTYCFRVLSTPKHVHCSVHSLSSVRLCWTLL